MEKLKISVSFKETEKDMYNFIKSQLSDSIYIKQLIKDKMKNENIQEQPRLVNKNVLDF